MCAQFCGSFNLSAVERHAYISNVPDDKPLHFACKRRRFKSRACCLFVCCCSFLQPCTQELDLAQYSSLTECCILLDDQAKTWWITASRHIPATHITDCKETRVRRRNNLHTRPSHKLLRERALPDRGRCREAASSDWTVQVI